jgi:predicted ATPase
VPEARAVALLLTDVEGSTRLLVRFGTAGVAALGRVAEVVSAAAGAHGGEVSRLQGEGDSAVVLFGSAETAVAAALELNERLAAERWPGATTVAVRSAVHVGEVSVSFEGVAGLEVHRCARVRALADGGEVFLSDAAVREVEGRLPSSSTVENVGVVLLRGFVRPERVWRLVHPVLRPRHDGIDGAGAVLGVVPAWRTSFVGRDEEVVSVVGRLRAGRVVTLVGSGGVGKTRLASAVVAQQPIATRFVDLTSATSDADVEALAAASLGADESAAPRASIAAALASEPTVVVLDNCEHVIDAAASLADHLAGVCDASVLATSRSALRLPNEDVVSVAPLSTERGGSASDLFLDRARSVQADLVVDDAVLDDVAAMTELLDGVPLALELAAARVSAFSVSEILDLLRRDAAGLVDNRRRGPDRHRSLRAAILWSIGLLGDEERDVLCRVAVLPGSFSLRTATAIVDGDEGAVATAVHGLSEQSLLSIEHPSGPTRYRLLEMVRAVGRGQLTTVERRDVLDRLLQHCIAELAGLDARGSPAKAIVQEIARDGRFYSTAVEHALSTTQTELGLRLVHDLFLAWHGDVQRVTLDRWMSRLVVQAATPSRMRGMVLRRQAIIATELLADDVRTQQLLDAAEADAIAVADQELLGRVRGTRANLDLHALRLDGLDDRLADALALLEATGDEYAADVLATQAAVSCSRGRFDEAERLYDRALSMTAHWFRRVHLELDRTWCALMSGRIDVASTRAAASLDLAERTGDSDLVAHAVEAAARAALASGQTEVAHELFLRMLAYGREHDLPNVADALAGLAIVAVVRGDLGAASASRDELRDRPHEAGDQELRMHHQLACAFVDQAVGNTALAASEATTVLSVADRAAHRYVRVLGTELLAAAVAGHDPAHARELLDVASQERLAIGAMAWPLEPFRDAALRALDPASAR